MRFLVTAGPTREYLDDVRFISNASSGRMGYAIARAAARAGHGVDLVTGPVDLPEPPGVNVTRVVSTQQMYQAVARRFGRADCLIGAAAPADFRPARRLRDKAKKSDTPYALELSPTIDILATLGMRKRRQVVIAFALEVRKPISNALEKLRRKHADAIVLNRPAALGAERSSATILLEGGDRIEVQETTKSRIGRLLVSLAERLHAEGCNARD